MPHRGARRRPIEPRLHLLHARVRKRGLRTQYIEYGIEPALVACGGHVRRELRALELRGAAVPRDAGGAEVLLGLPHLQLDLTAQSVGGGESGICLDDTNPSP